VTTTKRTRETKKAASKRTPAAKKTTKKTAAANRTAVGKSAVRKRGAAPGAKRATAKRAATKKTRSASDSGAHRARAVERLVRRAIYIDVENTSSEASLLEVLENLNIDRNMQNVELSAVGNWRAVGQHVGRRLAELGAQLVHSAPARGVRDWSDLWIAVAAGCWIGQANPGDILEIVSNDRAFDAVGDAAASRGIVYSRVQHRRGAAKVAASETKTSTSETKPARRSRGGRGRRRGRGNGRAPGAPSATPATTAAAAEKHAPPNRTVEEPLGATRDQIILTIDRLTHGEAERWVNLDILEKELKTEGFSRPPGSPRLVTRLRVLKDVEVDSHGRVRLAPGVAPPSVTPTTVGESPAPKKTATRKAAPKRAVKKTAKKRAPRRSAKKKVAAAE
jgi:hypothetical protein